MLRLSDLQRLIKEGGMQASPNLIHSIVQSVRAAGYQITEKEVLESQRRILPHYWNEVSKTCTIIHRTHSGSSYCHSCIQEAMPIDIRNGWYVIEDVVVKVDVHTDGVFRCDGCGFEEKAFPLIRRRKRIGKWL